MGPDIKFLSSTFPVDLMPQNSQHVTNWLGISVFKSGYIFYNYLIAYLEQAYLICLEWYMWLNFQSLI